MAVSKRDCEVCGKPYEAKRSDSRTCSPTCRAKKSKGLKREDAEREARAALPYDPGDLALVEMVRTTLTKAGQLDTVLGAGALVLARRLLSSGETGSAIAQLHRELRATIAIALQSDEQSPVAKLKDELAERRETVRSAGKRKRRESSK